jgi:hypothetical protein
MQEIEKVVEKIFVWAYKKRLEMQAVYLETIDNYALETNLFKIIRESNSYKDVVNMYISKINKSDIRFENIDEKIKTKILEY